MAGKADLVNGIAAAQGAWPWQLSQTASPGEFPWQVGLAATADAATPVTGDGPGLDPFGG